jgi:hypothetical protein
MKEWMQKQIDSGFRDLKGLSISAHIPVNDQLLNEVLSEVLRGASTPPTPRSGQAPDLRPLAQFVKKAEVRATEGTLVVDVEISV